jgi:hypothetical protein
MIFVLIFLLIGVIVHLLNFIFKKGTHEDRIIDVLGIALFVACSWIVYLKLQPNFTRYQRALQGFSPPQSCFSDG